MRAANGRLYRGHKGAYYSSNCRAATPPLLHFSLLPITSKEAARFVTPGGFVGRCTIAVWLSADISAASAWDHGLKKKERKEKERKKRDREKEKREKVKREREKIISWALC